MHVFSIAKELTRLGHSCVMLMPDDLPSLEQHETPTFAVMTYDQALASGSLFASDAPPDIIHAWSPREHVRVFVTALATRWRCRYLVHMEDNEQKIVADQTRPLSHDELTRLPNDLTRKVIDNPWRSLPNPSRAFIESASGYTCLIDTLLEFSPGGMATCTFWPGFDEGFADIEPYRRSARAKLKLAPSDVAILYSGNLHSLVREDIRSLYLAVALLRRRGKAVRLLRTGWDHIDLGLDAEAREAAGATELGFVPRAEVPRVLAAADILVHPGMGNDFNDYRFPSKIPEYLISGRPLLVSDSNIGAHLEDGVQAMKLRAPGAFEIADRLLELIDDRALAARIGHNGRRFAQRHLTWENAAKRLDVFYRDVLAGPDFKRLEPVTAARDVDFPVKLVALGSVVTDLQQGEGAGLYVSCIDIDGDAAIEATVAWIQAAIEAERAFCLRLSLGESDRLDDELVEVIGQALASPACLHVEDGILVVLEVSGSLKAGRAAVARLRAMAQDLGVGPLCIVGVEGEHRQNILTIGVDALIPSRCAPTEGSGKARFLAAVQDLAQSAEAKRFSRVDATPDEVGTSNQKRLSFKGFGFWLGAAVERALLMRDLRPALVFIDGWSAGVTDASGARIRARVARAATEKGIVDAVRGPSDTRDRDFTQVASQTILGAQAA